VPSARVLHAMERNHGGSYTRFVLAESLLHAGHLRGLPLPAEVARAYEEHAARSLAEQKRIEQSDSYDFETYRQKYLAHDRLVIRRRER